MIELKNLRLEKGEEWTKLVVDITADTERVPLPEHTIWFALPNEKAEMFSTETYDPFLLVPYYMGMFFGEDVTIHGKVSKVFYKNLTNYINQILDDFSDHTKKVALFVDGFGSVKPTGNVIGASGSCGIDSLCTIYDHYLNENDEEDRINTLFLFNCGTHGRIDRATTRKLWLDRFALNQRAAKELNLPIYLMDSNLHAFTRAMYHSDEAIGYLAIWSCILCLQKVIRKYYISSDWSFSQTLKRNNTQRDKDLSEYAAPMLVPLIHTENTTLIMDLAQYVRSERLVRISDWRIAQRYLNICVHPRENGENCTVNCTKCRAAMLVLESIGKTDLFRESFEVDLFRREMKKVKVNTVARYYNEFLCSTDAVDFVKSHGMKLPPFLVAAILHSPRKIKHLIKYHREGKYAVENP